MVRLDGDRRSAPGRHALDHVGIEGPLHQEPDVRADGSGLDLEDVDEFVADDGALPFRIGHAGEAREEAGARVDDPEIDAEVAPEGGLDLLPLVQAKEAVIHEDAREPVPDGAMHQRGGDAGVHSARQAADHPRRGSDHRANLRHFALDEVARRSSPARSRRHRRGSSRSPRCRGRCGLPRDGTGPPTIGRVVCSNPATGLLALDAVRTKPGGAVST